ncbi:uncharacterized protein LOC133896466 [Phragmites australis]|uniref:uncharacterized protein LOC133896466 n=1 Tax=Phragmites australis TaxID=29695 RepID=UPI002D78B92A|nr:uncharacterized protein LOC133896466 [Phragmites australis]
MRKPIWCKMQCKWNNQWMTLMCQMGKQSSSQNPFCTEQPNSNDEKDLRGVKADQQLLPLNCKQCNSNGAGLSNMGNTCFLNATLQYITRRVPLSLNISSTDHSTPRLSAYVWVISDNYFLLLEK